MLRLVYRVLFEFGQLVAEFGGVGQVEPHEGGESGEEGGEGFDPSGERLVGLLDDGFLDGRRGDDGGCCRLDVI